MSQRTVLNESYKGLVENLEIPAVIHERDGKKFASFGSAVPIHSCTAEEVAEKANSTHHYADIFTEQVLAPVGELAFVRLDENLAEKVFINRTKRMLLVSSDGHLAQWRCAPTFESANHYIAGTPIVNNEGALVSMVTAKRGNNYAVSSFEGEGGYFETSQTWKIMTIPEGGMVYGDRTFFKREEIREHISQVPPALVDEDHATFPVLHQGNVSRITLVAQNGRQLSHHYLQGVVTNDIEYL